jgi:hypothetical protein
MLMQTGSALHRWGVGTALGVNDLAVLADFGAIHVAGGFLLRLLKAAVPVMDVAAGVTLHGLPIAAVLGVFGMVGA